MIGEVLREIIRDVTCQVRQSSYCRGELAGNGVTNRLAARREDHCRLGSLLVPVRGIDGWPLRRPVVGEVTRGFDTGVPDGLFGRAAIGGWQPLRLRHHERWERSSLESRYLCPRTSPTGVRLAAPALVQLEANALDWLRDWMEFPAGTRGLFTTGRLVRQGWRQTAGVGRAAIHGCRAPLTWSGAFRPGRYARVYALLGRGPPDAACGVGASMSAAFFSTPAAESAAAAASTPKPAAGSAASPSRWDSGGRRA